MFNSVSSYIKNNLYKNRDINKLKECCIKTIFFSFIYLKDFKIDDNNYTEIIVDEYNYTLLKSIFKSLSIVFIIQKQEKNTKLIFESNVITNNLNLLNSLPDKNCCKINYLKISFLNCGYITDPNKSYHLEFSSNIQEKLNNVKELLDFFEIKSKIYLKNNKLYSLYIKNINYILKFLAIIKANKLLLEIENLLIEKDYKNKITRKVNYETANIEKTIESSVKYISAIEWYKEKGFFNNLPKNLQEVANIRTKYPDESLQELVKYFNFSITKSGINHRLRKLYAIIQRDKNIYEKEV
jgi:hypothetical protein